MRFCPQHGAAVDAPGLSVCPRCGARLMPLSAAYDVPVGMTVPAPLAEAIARCAEQLGRIQQKVA